MALAIDSKRVCIFFFYDKDGILDEYVIYLLKALKENVEKIIVVCNGKLTPESRDKLEIITEDIIVRENKGFDVWAYKSGIEYLGWDTLNEYDELLLVNFTIFGPIYSFKEMFKDMDSRDIDFWGITAFHEVKHDPFKRIKYGYIPEHIQSHFIAVRKRMFSSFEFKEHWEKMPEIKCYEDSVAYHEAIFTKDFNDKGFKYELYTNTEDLKNLNYYPLRFLPLELVKNKRCPIIKRRSFFNGYESVLANTGGEITYEMFEYIKNNTDYDVNLIHDNILRSCNQSDFKKNLQNNFILSSNYVEPYEGSKIKNKKIALILHIYFEDLIEYCFEYAKSIMSDADVYVTTDTDEKKEKIYQIFKELECKNLKIIKIENVGRDVSALLVACKDFLSDYDYVCFAHDKKVGQLPILSVGKSFSYKCFENILGSKSLVENIITTFEKNEKLGMLTPAPPNHADYYLTLCYEWGGNFEQTVELAKKLNLHVDIDKDKEPIAPLGTMFWFRPEAMEKLINYGWKYKDFPKEPNKYDGSILHAIERIYTYVVQDAGYYTGWLYSDKYAKIEITNLMYMLRELNNAMVTIQQYGTHREFVQMIKEQKFGLKTAFKRSVKFRAKKYLPASTVRMLKKIFK